jgi:hypothetical protein
LLYPAPTLSVYTLAVFNRAYNSVVSSCSQLQPYFGPPAAPYSQLEMSGRQEYGARNIFGEAPAPPSVSILGYQQSRLQEAYPWGPVAHTYPLSMTNHLGPFSARNGTPSQYVSIVFLWDEFYVLMTVRGVGTTPMPNSTPKKCSPASSRRY